MKYVPLHIHTEYSKLDSTIKIQDLYKFAAENNMPAIAITDHGTMAGCAEMFVAKNELLSQIQQPELKEKIKAVKPIIGCEFYVCDCNLKERHRTTLYHLVLLAKNQNGYHNLCKLNSIAMKEGFFYKPRINHELIEQYKDDLICLSACIQGEVARTFLDGDKDKAIEIAKYYKNLFGEDYYIELQDHNLEQQKVANQFLLEVAKELNIKTVITNDSHYLRKADADLHDTLICEQTNSSKDDPNRFRFVNEEFYVKTPEELKNAFSWMGKDCFNRSIDTTIEVADKCNFEMDELEITKAKEYIQNLELI